MINLIPPDAQKQVRTEYWIRVATVWMFLFGTGFLIVAILNAPVYVLVRSQLDSYLLEYNQASDETQSFKDAETTINDANSMIALLGVGTSVMPFSSVIAKLETLTGDGIAINSYKFSRKNGAIDSIVIDGLASSRLSLSQFKDALQKDDMFKSASLPLSNLAKDVDIPFTITITPAPVNAKS